MSVEATRWVWESSSAAGTDFVVLLALAWHHRADSGDCYPGQRQLARDARISQSSASRSIRRLADHGEIVVVPGRGRRSTRYRFPSLSTGISDSSRANRYGSGSDSSRADRNESRSDSREAISDSNSTRSDSPKADRIRDRDSDRGRRTDPPPNGVGPALPTRSAREIRAELLAVEPDLDAARSTLDEARHAIGRPAS